MKTTPGNFEMNIISLFREIHPLDRVPRSGFLLRGVAECESVSSHMHFLTLLTLLFTERYKGEFDREKSLIMAVIHDIPEAMTMDIPLPVSDTYIKENKESIEFDIFSSIFKNFSQRFKHIYKEYNEKKSKEARLVAGLDKAQMMLKVLCYEHENRGNLSEFWQNPANFNDYGITQVKMLFDEIRKEHSR